MKFFIPVQDSPAKLLTDLAAVNQLIDTVRESRS